MSFIRRLVLRQKKITDQYEIIFVNDGSPDNSLEIVISFYEKDKKVKVIDLSRNFGHHYAISAGLCLSKGDSVFLIDCDLETSPCLLTQFYDKILEGEHDVVYGYQNKRTGNLFERWSGNIFWNVFNFLSDTRVPKNVLTVRLMTRRYVDQLMKLGDKNLFLAGMMYWTGFSQKGIPIKRKKKKTSTYHFLRKVNLLINAVSSFSSKPLLLMFHAGSLITFLSLLCAMIIIFRKIISPDVIILGWTSIIVAIFFAMGLTISCLGIIGIYLSKMYNQIQNRPLYIIRKIYKEVSTFDL